ncbi:MAG: Ca2+-dependent phosphoinositide-specific phospholipase C [Microthrixaceae bacterium]
MRQRNRSRRGRTTSVLIVAMAVVVATVACSNDDSTSERSTTTSAVGVEDTVRLNQIQLVGSHNSYHVAPAPEIMTALEGFVNAVPSLKEQFGDPAALDYTHAPLTDQLDRGIRTFELDVYADPEGGLYSHPFALTLLKLPDSFAPKGMDEPGFKVLHIADLDFHSTCQTLKACLGEITTWSKRNPRHIPIVINLELKSDGIPIPGATKPLPFDPPTLDRLDEALRAELGSALITPDEVRGSAKDLRTAVSTTGWPTLAKARGRVLIFMDNESLRDTYLQGHAGLVGRAMFTSSGYGKPDGAVLKLNDPDDKSIPARVKEGYLVRTRADDDPAKPGVPAQRDRALASGAQIVHSDHPIGEAAADGYVVKIGDSVQVRCDPLLEVKGCSTPELVEGG